MALRSLSTLSSLAVCCDLALQDTGKTNFFEKKVGEYQKAGVMGGGDAAGEDNGQ